MFQRKLIVSLCVVAVLAFTAGVGHASYSRVEGMNLTVPVLSQFTDDYVNIYYYPTSVVRQNNLVIAELGNNPGGGVNSVSHSDQSLTLIHNFPRFGAIAFQMKQAALNSMFPNNLNNEQLDAIWGKGFEKIDLAVRLDITNSKFEQVISSGGAVTTSYDYRGYSYLPAFSPYPFGGISYDAIDLTGVELNTWGVTPAIAIHMQNDNRIEGAVSVRKYKLDRSTSLPSPAVNEKWEDQGNTSYALGARGVINQGDRYVWYPAAWYVNDDLGWTVTNAGGVAGITRGADETYKVYGAGISNNMRVNDNNLLLTGVAAWQWKHEYTRTDDGAIVAGTPNGGTRSFEEKETMGPIVFAALETDATKWLKVRIGASKALVNYKSTQTSFGTPSTIQDFKERWSDFQFGLGTGIRWNNLDIDMTLNQDFPLSGGWVLSGNEATPFTRVSATYHY
jgi:hypothetical protein